MPVAWYFKVNELKLWLSYSQAESTEYILCNSVVGIDKKASKRPLHPVQPCLFVQLNPGTVEYKNSMAFNPAIILRSRHVKMLRLRIQLGSREVRLSNVLTSYSMPLASSCVPCPRY